MTERSIEVRVKADIAQARAAMKDFAGDVRQVADEGKRAAQVAKQSAKEQTQAAQQTSKAQQKATQQTERATRAQEQSAKKQSRSWSDMSKKTQKDFEDIGKTMTVGVTAPLVAIGGIAILEGKKFESAFAGVRKTVDGSEADLGRLRQGIIDMANEIPSSREEIAGVAEAAGQLGIQTPNILGFTRTMIDLGNSTNLSAQDAATQLARLANITGMSQGDFDRLGSSIVALGNNFATTESEIVAMSMRLAGSGKLVGLNEHQITGLATAMSSVGIEAEAGGTAMSQAMSMINTSVAGGGKKLDAFAKVSGVSASEFKKQWKTDAAQALVMFTKGLGKVADNGGDMSQTLSDLGFKGIRLQDVMKRLAGSGELLGDALAKSKEGWEQNTALSKEAEQRYKTLDSQLVVFKNKISGVAMEFGTAMLPALSDAINAAQPLIDILSSMARGFSELDPETRKWIVGLAAVAAATGPALLVTAKLIEAGRTLASLNIAQALMAKAAAHRASAVAANADAAATSRAAAAQVSWTKGGPGTAAKSATAATAAAGAGAAGLGTIISSLAALTAASAGAGYGLAKVQAKAQETNSTFGLVADSALKVGTSMSTAVAPGVSGFYNFFKRQGEEAERSTRIIEGAASVQGVLVRRLGTDFSGAIDTIRHNADQAGVSFDDMVQAMPDVQAKLQSLGYEAGMSGDQLNELGMKARQAFDQLSAANDVQFDQALMSMRKQIEQTGGDFRSTTEEGLQNRQMLVSLAQQTKNYGDALKAQGVPADKADQAMRRQLLSINKLLPAGKNGERAMNLLARAMGKTPKEIKSQIKLAGQEKAIADLNKLDRQIAKKREAKATLKDQTGPTARKIDGQLNALVKKRREVRIAALDQTGQGIYSARQMIASLPSSVRIPVTIAPFVSKAAQSSALNKRAGGGPVYGPGSSTSDSIITALSDGEHVIKTSSASKNRQRLEYVNRTGDWPNRDEIPGYAKGGKVTLSQKLKKGASGKYGSAVKSAVKTYNSRVQTQKDRERDLKQVKDNRASHIAGVRQSISGGSVSVFDLNAYASAQENTARAVEAQADAQKNLTEAKRRANQATNPADRKAALLELREAQQKYADSVQATADAKKAEAAAKPTKANIITSAKNKAAQARTFLANIKKMQSLGFAPAIIRDVISKGLDEGGEWAAILATFSVADRNEYNSAWASLDSASAGIGTIDANLTPKDMGVNKTAVNDAAEKVTTAKKATAAAKKVVAKAKPKAKKKAAGGRMYGPGTTTSDSIPSMLSRDEFVIKAASAQGNYPELEYLNRYGEWPQGFALGGLVGTSMSMSSSAGRGAPVQVHLTIEQDSRAVWQGIVDLGERTNGQIPAARIKVK